MSRLEELERLERGAATKGEWVAQGIEVYAVVPDSPQAEAVVWMGSQDGAEGGCVFEADADLIAEMRNALPALLACVKAAQEVYAFMGPDASPLSVWKDLGAALAPLAAEEAK